MIRFVNAKINLGLNIVRKRPDGYHDLETLFYPVGLYNGSPENPEPFGDILEVHLRNSNCGDEFIFSGRPIDCPLEKNLVFRALRLFRETTGIATPVSIRLDKHIPDGAGLGGGSADASFTLSVLNRLTGTPLSREKLINLAGSLGADCPFFIENRPVFASGIGEIMIPSLVDLRGFWLVLVKPDVYVSTKEAFAGISPSVPDKSIQEIVSLPVDRWEEAGLKNDFEPHIFRLHPVLGIIKEELKSLGASYAAMSGSGSSLFGIFTDRSLASEACKAFLRSGNQTFLIKL